MITWNWCEVLCTFADSGNKKAAFPSQWTYCLWNWGHPNPESEELYSVPRGPNNVNSSWAIGLMYLEERLLYVLLSEETRLPMLRVRVGQMACHSFLNLPVVLPSPTPYISQQPSAISRLEASPGSTWKAGSSLPWSFLFSTLPSVSDIHTSWSCLPL